MINVDVKFFGPLRDIVRSNEISLEVPPPHSGDSTFDALVVIYPELSKWRPSVRLAVNFEYVPFTHNIRAGDEVSLIPPVSGG